MRKHQQRQILELLMTVKEAQDAALYADCQDGALVVGEFIESIEGEGTQTVSLLEEYCELVFKASNGEATQRTLDKQLVTVINSVRSELRPNRLEVLFLAYRPSVWDSFESIYLAAKDDPGCDVCVVPMPYFVINADGNPGEMTYEGGKYPPDVPIEDWQDYDVEARHPDIIFTHYPYDSMGGNYRIHPKFYSKELRQHCELLVHVPYFVAVNDEVADYNGYLPGILYADRVIVQSEAVRQSYIKHYKYNDKEQEWKGKFGKAEEKFIALGSPKFDKVINSKPEDFGLPEDWKKLICKPDGTKKRVILYNTHMFTWLNNADKYFKKVRRVLDIFKSRDDAVLWWRPHPTTVENFALHKPQYLGNLKELFDGCKYGGWGIFDDTPDLHRAIAWTDAYYGDWSSLLAMYKTAGKPFLIQLPEFSEPDKSGCKTFFYSNGRDGCGTLCNTSYYDTFSAVTGIDTDSLSMRFYCDLPVYEQDFFPLQYSYIFREIGGKMFFAPRWYVNGSHLAIYDRKTHQFDYIPLDDKYNNALLDDEDNAKPKAVSNTLKQSFSPKFSRIFHYKDSLYITPGSYPAIAQLNLKTYAVSYHTDFIDEVVFAASKKGRRVSYAFNDAVQAGNKIYVGCRWADLLIVFDMETHVSKIIELSDRECGSALIRCDGEHIWVFSLNELCFSKWNPNTGKLQVYNSYPQEISDIPQWHSMILFNGFFYASMANNGKTPLAINTATGETGIATNLLELINTGDKSVTKLNQSGTDKESILSFLSIEDKLYFTTDKSRIFETDKDGKAARIGDIYPSEDERQRYREKINKYYQDIGFPAYTEAPYFTLNDLLNESKCRAEVNSSMESSGNSGRKIYEYVKEKVKS